MLTRLNIAPVLTADHLRQTDRLARLRETPGILKTPPASPHIEHDGIFVPRGAITEISGPPGSGKTEWTLRFISSCFSNLCSSAKDSGQHSNQDERIGMVGSGGVVQNRTTRVATRVAWIEDAFTANPRGFAEHGADLSQFLFVEGGKDALWATHQVLRSQLFGAVVLWVRESVLSATKPSVELRKLQLSAEQAGAPLLLLCSQPRPTGVNWPVSLQMNMDPRTRRPRILQQSPRSEEVGHERRRPLQTFRTRLHSA